nr:MAG TPA: hypothetical protein [Caudoviricetes sp.]
MVEMRGIPCMISRKHYIFITHSRQGEHYGEN